MLETLSVNLTGTYITICSVASEVVYYTPYSVAFHAMIRALHRV